MLNLINKNSARILLFLAISPGSNYSRKEIKEKTSINNLPLDSYLTELLFFRMINKKNKLYSLNLENSLVKIILDETKGKFSNFPLKVKFILIDFIFQISKIKNIKNIILFGSYSKLVYTENSDIDLAVIFGRGLKNKEVVEKKIFNISEKISKRYKKEIQEHFFSEDDLKKKDPLINDIVKNGLVLI